MNINKCPNYHYQAFSDYVIYVNRIIALKIYSLLLLNYVIMQCLNTLCHHAIVIAVSSSLFQLFLFPLVFLHFLHILLDFFHPLST